jgi:hypothetical protein
MAAPLFYVHFYTSKLRLKPLQADRSTNRLGVGRDIADKRLKVVCDALKGLHWLSHEAIIMGEKRE